MPRLVDHEAVVLDLRGALQERASWGRAQVLALIDALEQRHRVDERVEEAVLRRFGIHLHESLLGLVPSPSATRDPLAADAPRTSAAMDAGAASDHPPHEGATHVHHHRDLREAGTPAGREVERRRTA